MYLSICGFNHKTASVEEREPFQLARAELIEAVRRYKELSGCDEVVVVATCNRVEFYRVALDRSEHLQEVLNFYEKRGTPAVEMLRNVCYCRQKTTAARHLFRVASGLDSMVLGEDQVFHQLKEAYSAACAAGGPGKVLHKLFHLAFQVGKKVRAETEIGSGPRGVPGAALEMLKGRLNGRIPSAVLVCGVNEMTEIILDGLTRWGVPVILANRTVEKAEKLAAAFKAKSLPIDEIGQVIGEVEAVFSATSAPGHIITHQQFSGFRERENPLYLIDIAVPRDIEPELGLKQGVILFDLQDIKRYLEHSDQVRSRDVPAAEAMIEAQVKAYSAWRRKEKQQSKLLLMHRELNRMRKTELERFKEGFHLSEYRALDAFSQSLVRSFMKLLPEVLDEEDALDKKSKSGDESN